MPQYKDIDAILNSLPNDLPYKASVKRVLIQAPEADVVPKSEAENYKQIAENQQKLSMDRYFEINHLKEEIAKAKTEVAREIFEEIEKEIKKSLEEHKNKKLQFNIDDALFHLHHGITASQMGMLDFIAELKKKYTEADNEASNKV